VNTLHGDEEFLRQLHQGENIKVHRATIISMSGTSVVLDNGETLPSDAVVFATGWEPSTSMFSASSAIDLGVPAPLQYQDTTTTAYWHDLATRANADLRATYPILDTAPDYHKKEWNHTPFRLYRHIVPHSLAASRDRSLIFLGYLTNLQTAMYCEVAGLWGISWMEGLLPEKSMPENKQEMDYDIARFNKWCEMRYLSRGQTRMVAGAEIQDIIDLLMTDMGLEAHRKKGIWSDQILPYRAHYYKGIVEEVLKKAREKKDCDCTIPTKT
jgi:dimethylaniline monooxygenase (N-oxide forming)